MFKKIKSRKIVKNTIKDVAIFLQELNTLDVYPQADTAQIEVIYIALSTFFLSLHKKEELGEHVINEYIRSKGTPFLDGFYRDIINGFNKEYFRILQEDLSEDFSPDGMTKCYFHINNYICETLQIKLSSADIIAAVDCMLFSRRKDCV